MINDTLPTNRHFPSAEKVLPLNPTFNLNNDRYFSKYRHLVSQRSKGKLIFFFCGYQCEREKHITNELNTDIAQQKTTRSKVKATAIVKFL